MLKIYSLSLPVLFALVLNNFYFCNKKIYKILINLAFITHLTKQKINFYLLMQHVHGPTCGCKEYQSLEEGMLSGTLNHLMDFT